MNESDWERTDEEQKEFGGVWGGGMCVWGEGVKGGNDVVQRRKKTKKGRDKIKVFNQQCNDEKVSNQNIFSLLVFFAKVICLAF